MPTFYNTRVFVGIVELLHVTDVDKSLLVEIHFAERLHEDQKQEFGLCDNRYYIMTISQHMK